MVMDIIADNAKNYWTLEEKERERILCSKRYSLNHPIEHKAHRKLQRAVKDGHIKRQPCVECGNLNAHGHHSDYSREFDVVWLCHKHHMALHYPKSV
jgi:hypothetical protein